MYAIRSIPLEFRVQQRLYHHNAWFIEEEITDEHRFVQGCGHLLILSDVTGPDDPALLPYPVDSQGMEAAVAPTLASLSDDVRRLTSESQDKDQRIADLAAQAEVLTAQVQAIRNAPSPDADKPTPGKK